MKNVLLICLVLVGLVAQAQDNNSEFKNETIAFIKLTGATAAFDSAIAQIGNMVSDTNKDAYTKEAEGTLDALYDKMATLYMTEFTEAEIKELVAFYKTDLGKKLAEKQLALSQKAMMYGQSWGMELQSIAQKYN